MHNKIFDQLAAGNFNSVEKLHKDTVNYTDNKGWTVLHYLAEAESKKIISLERIIQLTNWLLAAGANVHQEAIPIAGQIKGDTAFNIAAPASPIIGRLMTNNWLERELQGTGIGINTQSGSHNSTLAQYIAKWSNDEEINEQLDKALAIGMNLAVQNTSGWTPLHAAAAMTNRLAAVQAFAWRYTSVQRDLQTTLDAQGNPYAATYLESPERIVYGAGLTAAGVAATRLYQAKTLPQKNQEEFQRYIRVIEKINAIKFYFFKVNNNMVNTVHAVKNIRAKL